MVQITRQTPKSKAMVNHASAISKIRKVEVSLTGIKMNVYGRSKTGKTRLACSFPKPLLILGTEDGTKSVSNVSGLSFAPLERSADIDDFVLELKKGKYKSAVLDTAGGLQNIILKEVLGIDDLPINRSWGMAERGDWMACGAQTNDRLRALLGLAETHGLNVIIIAHERNFNDEGTPSDVMIPSVGSALTPASAGWLDGACDYICQTFIREGVSKRQIKMGKEVRDVQQKTGIKEFCLRVGPHPVYKTGFRLPIGVALPEVMVDPSYEKIAKLITGS